MELSAQHNGAESYIFEALFNHACIGIVLASSKGDIYSINPFALKLFGYTGEEVIGRKIEMLIPDRYRYTHVGHRETYWHSPKSRPMGLGRDLFAVRKDGSEFPVEVSLGNYQNEDDKNIIAFINDISVRKKAEAEIVKLNDELEMAVEERTRDLREILRQLEISKEKLEKANSFQKALVDNAGAMIIGTDETGIIKFLNPEVTINTGYLESEVVDKQSLVLFHDKNEIGMRRRELFKEFGVVIKRDIDVLVEKTRRNIHVEEQYTYIRKDVSSFPVSLTITAIRDTGGAITGFIGIGIDISERQKIEENLRTALEKEKELSELKSRFVSMASHEFRTPLSTVLSSAYLIEKYATAEGQQKREQHLQRIVSSVNMLTDILNDFLSVGKIEEGRIQVKLTLFNIQELTLSVITEIKNTLKKQQKIHYTHDGDTNVELDVTLMKHIIMNLITNASKFSKEKDPIDVKTINDGGQIIFSIKDHGIGIPEDDQKHLAEPFFRSENAGNIQGTGLGLHIVAKYAELMNGVLECKSELSSGTEFVITFNTKAHGNENNFTN